MRRSAWIPAIIAMALWVAAIAWPTIAALATILMQQSQGSQIHQTTQLLLVSTSWGLAAAMGAMLLGWAPGRLLGSALSRRGFAPLAAFLLVPICLPAYVIFFAWWQAWPAGSWLYAWAVEHQQVQMVRHATLLVGFLCWSWPVVALCVAGSVASIPAERVELLRIDGATWRQRLFDRLRCDARGLALGGLIIFLATFNNTTSFDLAEVFTFGNELRAIEALGGSNRDVLTAAAPATLLTALGATLIWFLLGTKLPGHPVRTSPARLPAAIFTVALWLTSVAIPLVLLARNVRTAAGGRSFGEQLHQFRLFYTQGLLNTLAVALVSASLAVIVAIGLAWMWQDRRRWVRCLAHAQAIGWIIVAALPGTLVGVALRSAYNRPILDDLVYNQPAVLILGHLASFAFLGALLGRWTAMREPSSLRDLRSIDGADTLVALAKATWPRLVAAGAATFAIVFALSLSEIPITAAVRPAGFDSITTSILNDMHFQRPQTVMIATGIFLCIAIVAAVSVAVVWRMLRQRTGFTTTANVMLLCMIALLCVGCGSNVDGQQAQPLRTELIFGSPGRALGQFNYPRALAIDHDKGYVYIVDVTARIQRYGLDGKPEMYWLMPEWELGKPTGLAVGDDGNLYVADTHYFRVMAFDSHGNEVLRFGRFGQGPGEFVYTTGIAFGPEGRIYVSESGGNDRVQVFDATGRYLFHFGSFGSELDQFNRPQSLAFNADRTELYIVDACNHRIVVTDPQGRVLRTLGEAGSGPGQFSYPYDIAMLPDGNLVVCEYHNARIQKITPYGESLGLYGRVGRGRGELQFPWGVEGDARRLFVLDSGNNRVQVIATP